MVTSEENDVFGIFQFITEEKLNGLNGIISAVNKIPNENIPRSREFPSDLKEF
jgi:hypothetical protein